MARLDTKYIDSWNYLELHAEEYNVNQQGNYSSVHAWLELHVTSGGHVASSGIVAKVSNGQNNIGYHYYGAGTHRLVDGYYDVAHDSNGNASTWVTGSFESYIGNWYFGGTLNLTHIDREKSTITSFTGTTITGNFVATYTGASGKTKVLRISIPGVMELQRYNNYASGQEVTLSAEAIQKIKNYTQNTTVSIGGVIETWDGGTKIGESQEIVIQCSAGGKARIRVNGQWKDAVPYVRVNGQWKEAVPYTRVNSQWKEGI